MSSIGGKGYSVKSMVTVSPSNFKNRQKVPVVTVPYMVLIEFFAFWLNFCAATISAIHCPKPILRFSFLASTNIATGALTNNCSLERLRIKSHIPVKPVSASTLNSSPENKLISLLKASLTAKSKGQIISCRLG